MKNNIALCLFLICSLSCVSQEVDYLTIEGSNIWIREYPTTGDVIMKLNSGEICKVLKKDKKEVINGISDFWYKIDYKGQIGWVFGSQTSIKQGSIELSVKVDNAREFIEKVFDGYLRLRFEKGLNIKIIDKIIDGGGDENYTTILFEYKYSEKAPSLIFVSKTNAGDPTSFFYFKKTMNLNYLEKKIIDNSIVTYGGFDFVSLLFTKKEILVGIDSYTSINTTVGYKLDKSGVMIEIPQNEYFINKKTVALESFDFFESKSLKKIKGYISKNENITIISTNNKSYIYGGLFKIKSERGVLGWINLELHSDSRENKPKLKNIVTNIW